MRMGQIDDDRTDNQKAATVALVVMTDAFLSGWGSGCPRVSYAAWPVYDRAHLGDAEARVRNRGEARRVRVVGPDYRPRIAGDCHLHIYDNEPDWAFGPSRRR
jgi:hypothetical protein